MPDSVRSMTVGGVTEILIDRPPVNALDTAAIGALTAAFATADKTLPIVLTGNGEAFSAGVDTKAFAGYSKPEQAEMIRAITGMTAQILSHPAPLIAAVNGHALGGGFVLMLCADVRLVAARREARFGLTEAKAGVPFPSGPLEIIRHEMEPNLLRRLTLTSETLGADALLATGVADRLVPLDDLSEIAREIALETARQPAFTAVKQQVRGALIAKVRTLAAS